MHDGKKICFPARNIQREVSIKGGKDISLNKVEESRATSVEKINNIYNEALQSIAQTPLKFELNKINDFNSEYGPGCMDGLTHVIDTKESGIIISLTLILHYTAYGLSKPILWEGITCYCGTLANKPIPTPIIVKNVKMGLRRKPHFIPYIEKSNFSAKDILNKREAWNPLLESLNGDIDLQNIMKKLPTEKTIFGIDEQYQAGRDKFWKYQLDDQDNNTNTLCQLIPFGDKTLIATRYMIEEPKRIIQAVETISRIKVYIEEFNSSRYVIGKIPQIWANDIFTLVNKFSSIRENGRISEQIEIQKNDVKKIEQPIKNSINIQELCPSCGAKIFSNMIYCGECGKSLLGNEVQPICSRCGAKIESRMNFCGNCGLSLINS
jgi:hypothetical protein